MKKIILSLLFTLSFVFGFSQYDLSKNIERQVMVVPERGMESQAQSFIKENNAEIVANFEQLGWYVVLLPENLTQDSFVRSSKDLPFIKEVYKDQRVEMKLDYIPNDVEFSQCWHLRQTSDKDIDADEAWDLVPATNPTVSILSVILRIHLMLSIVLQTFLMLMPKTNTEQLVLVRSLRSQITVLGLVVSVITRLK